MKSLRGLVVLDHTGTVRRPGLPSPTLSQPTQIRPSLQATVSRAPIRAGGVRLGWNSQQEYPT